MGVCRCPQLALKTTGPGLESSWPEVAPPGRSRATSVASPRVEPAKCAQNGSPDPSRDPSDAVFILGSFLKAPGPENGPWGPKTTKNRGRRENRKKC